MIERFLNQAPEKQKLGELETKLRELLLQSGAQLLQPVLQALADQFDASFQPRPTQRFAGRKPFQVQGLFGLMPILRDYYVDADAAPEAGQGHCPADAALALEGSYTPALARMLCRAAAKSPYREASEDLWDYAGIKVPPSQIQRWALEIAPALPAWLRTQHSAPEAAWMYISADGTARPCARST